MLNKLKSLSIKEIFLVTLCFIVSYLHPLVGLLVIYMNKNNQTRRKSCIYGISIALILFTINYLIYVFH